MNNDLVIEALKVILFINKLQCAIELHSAGFNAAYPARALQGSNKGEIKRANKKINEEMALNCFSRLLRAAVHTLERKERKKVREEGKGPQPTSA